MTSRTIPVDPFNPGQVFACLGLMEIAQELFGHAAGRFDDGDPHDVRFAVHSDHHGAPIEKALLWLSHTDVSVLVPQGRSSELAKWTLDVHECPHDSPFPVAPPKSPAVMPAVLSADGCAITVDSWADETGRDTTKWWAGMGGCPGARLLDDALELSRNRLETEGSDPFAIREARSSSFRFDVRGEYVPRHAGFSPNKHSAVTSWGFPAVDVLAAIGLRDARPLRPDPRDKLLYRYGIVIDRLVDVTLHRAALGCAPLPYRMRTFEIQLDWPGQEDQARSITSVTEMPLP